MVGAHGGKVLNEDFAAEVTVTAQLTVERFPAFASALQEMSSGTVNAEIVETNEATIMPIDE